MKLKFKNQQLQSDAAAVRKSRGQNDETNQKRYRQKCLNYIANPIICKAAQTEKP